MTEEVKHFDVILARLTETLEGPPATIGNLLEILGHYGFYLVMLLGGLLLIIPLPYAITFILCIPPAFAAAQMASGYHFLKLPTLLARHMIHGQRAAKMLRTLLPYLHTTQTMCKPRMLHLFTPRNEQLAGLCCFVMAIAMLLPSSVLDPVLSAVGLALTGFALIFRNGRLLLIGCAIGLLSIAFTVITLLLLGLVMLF